MYPFLYRRVADVQAAVGTAGNAAWDGPPTEAPAQFLAGGTTLLDLMKLGTMRPEIVVDINDLAREHGTVAAGGDGLRLGALVRMSAAAAHPAILRDYPAIAQSLQQAASAQLRNMASLGGNVLQRTRCEYFRDPSWRACNKRLPGSGCAALEGVNRKHAVLGVGERCIAEYPGDLAPTLVAFGAVVETLGPDGPRQFPLEELHRGPEDPNVETVLAPGEIITGFTVPAGPWTRRSLYLKVRDRESYAFGLATAAVALDLRAGTVVEARIGLGGVAYRPWRAHEAEAVLKGQRLSAEAAEAAAEAAFAGAVTRDDNAYKPELGRRTLVRAVMQAAALEV